MLEKNNNTSHTNQEMPPAKRTLGLLNSNQHLKETPSQHTIKIIKSNTTQNSQPIQNNKYNNTVANQLYAQNTTEEKLYNTENKINESNLKTDIKNYKLHMLNLRNQINYTQIKKSITENTIKKISNKQKGKETYDYISTIELNNINSLNEINELIEKLKNNPEDKENTNPKNDTTLKEKLTMIYELSIKICQPFSLKYSELISDSNNTIRDDNFHINLQAFRRYCLELAFDKFGETDTNKKKTISSFFNSTQQIISKRNQSPRFTTATDLTNSIEIKPVLIDKNSPIQIDPVEFTLPSNTVTYNLNELFKNKNLTPTKNNIKLISNNNPVPINDYYLNNTEIIDFIVPFIENEDKSSIEEITKDQFEDMRALYRFYKPAENKLISINKEILQNLYKYNKANYLNKASDTKIIYNLTKGYTTEEQNSFLTALEEISEFYQSISKNLMDNFSLENTISEYFIFIKLIENFKKSNHPKSRVFIEGKHQSLVGNLISQCKNTETSCIEIRLKHFLQNKMK